MIYFIILLITYSYAKEIKPRSPLYYYPFSHRLPPTTSMEKMIHDLDFLVEQNDKTKNSTKIKP